MMNWTSVLPLMLLLTGAALLGYLLDRAMIVGRREEINIHRQQLMEECNDLKQQNTELIHHLQGMRDERHLMEDIAVKRKEEREALVQKISQLEREKAFIIREFHQLKSETQPGENKFEVQWQQEKEEMEEVLDRLKKTIVVLNSELNTLKDKTSINPHGTEMGDDASEKF